MTLDARRTDPKVQDNGRLDVPTPDTSFNPRDFEDSAPAPEPDPFDDVNALRLDESEEAEIDLERALLKVPVGKPSREQFFRVHPDPAYRLPTKVLELRDGGKGGLFYLLHPSLRQELAEEPTVSARLLVTVVYRSGDCFLWPLRMPKPDGSLDDWSRSALAASTLAESHWVRLRSGTGAYVADVARGALAEPKWPKKSFDELLRLAFQDRFIQSFDHEVLRKLRGEV